MFLYVSSQRARACVLVWKHLNNYRLVNKVHFRGASFPLDMCQILFILTVNKEKGGAESSE